MNNRMILYILGQMTWVEALLMVPSLLVSAGYREGEAVFGFAAAIVLLCVAGLLLCRLKPANRIIYAREGFVIVALSWVVLSLFGALPFFFSRTIPSFVDAVFETVSGFTTTGASILTEVESLPRGILFWRSFTHWVGGMGVLVFVLAIVPLAGERSIHLMRAEVPGPTMGKLVPKLRSTAMILYGLYVALTLLQVILLMAGGMPVYDSLVNAFATAGTGGFAVKNLSIAAYQSPYVDGVITIFMILFGVNFNQYYFLSIGKLSSVWKSEEMWCYFGIIALSILLITVNILPQYAGIGEALRYASFQVGSIITTTGFATADFNLWPEFSRMILVLLMILGACAGSTGGGIKTARLIILVKSAGREIRRMLHPHSVSHVRMDGKAMDGETLHGVHVFFVIYMVILSLSMLLLALDGFDFETTATAVIACLNNIGPGLGIVGPMGNYASFSDFGKLLLSLDMLVGRLEIFPMIMLLSPTVWRRQ